MKILRISSWPSKQTQGVGLAAYMLSSIGDEGSYTIAAKSKDTELLDHPLCPRRLISIPFLNPTMPTKRSSIGFYIKMMERIIKLLVFYGRALCVLRLKSFDLVHLHSPMYLPIGLYYKAKGAKLALSFHGSDFAIVKRNRIWLHLIKHCDHLFCVSEDQRKFFSETLSNVGVHHVNNGVNLQFFSPGEKKKQLGYLTISVGSLRWQKGYEFLIHAFSDVVNKQPLARLQIYGDGPDKIKLEQLIKRLNLDQHVILAGHIDQNGIRDAMRKADLFVSSSVSEGLPKVLLEAMACACPVITTDVGESGAAVGRGGIVVPPENVGALSISITQVIENHKLRKELSKLGSKRARDFSWEKYLSSISRIYSAHVANRG